MFLDTDLCDVRNFLCPVPGHPIFVLEDIPSCTKKDPEKEARDDDSTATREERNHEVCHTKVTHFSYYLPYYLV